jgi:formylglycine-generating enzyme
VVRKLLNLPLTLRARHLFPMRSLSSSRQAVFSLILLVTLAGCGLFGGRGGRNGELTGSEERPKWDNPEPYGMALIPPGSFHMGQNDQDVNYSQIAQNRQITISAFWMDDGEITNNEYRQFTEASVTPDGAVGEEAFLDSIKPFVKRMYGYEILDPAYKRLIFPDTLVWVRDFAYSYNEPMVENYYWHPAFDEYPVVGVNWYAAQVFAYWRTLKYNTARDEAERPRLPRFRLPSEAEWEYAARGGYEHKLFPWEGLYLRNAKGCFLANFKNQRGDYIGDNFSYTAPSKNYFPNDYGLYDMSGNVAEWCEDDFEETGYTYTHDLNPVYRGDAKKTRFRKVIRGGSWKDIGYFLSVGTRTYEYADTTKAYIGIRCVVSVIGRQAAANL